MNVKIKLFASARESLRSNLIEINVPRNCTLTELQECLGRDFPEFKSLPGRWAVNLEIKTADYALRGDEEIAWIPPVSGG